MRFIAPIMLLFMLAACQREPDFDERYKAANEKVRSMAAEIDAQISEAPPPDTEEGAAEEGPD
jgi:hypothetical protein